MLIVEIKKKSHVTFHVGSNKMYPDLVRMAIFYVANLLRVPRREKTCLKSVRTVRTAAARECRV